MIDKSLRYKYQWGGPGGKSPGTSASGGSRNGSHDRGGAQHRAAAQRATQAPSPHRDDSAERAAQAAADALNAAREAEARETAREKAIQVAALTPKTIEPIRSAHVDTPTQIAEQKEIDLYGYQDAKARAPTTLIPRYKEVTKGVPFLEDPITQKQRHYYGPIGSQIQPTGFGSKGDKTWHEAAEAGMKRGFWDSGLGNLLKGAGAAVALPFASTLLPKDMMTALTWGKRGYDLKQGKYDTALQKLGINRSNLISNIEKAKGRQFDPKDPIGWTGEQKRTKTFHEGEGGDKQQETTVQEAIAGKGLEEGQKMLGIDEIKKRYSLLQTTLNNGYYVDNKGRTIQLNDQQKAMLTNYISQIDDYLVNVDTRTMSAYGGRIDKPLTGRSRDI